MESENNTQPHEEEQPKSADFKEQVANNKITLLAVAGLLLLGGAAAVFGGQLLGNSSGSNEVVARVNGEAIQRSTLESQVAQLKSQQGASSQTDDKQLQATALDQLIGQKLLVQEAQKSGITVNEEEINSQISELKSGFESDAQFQQQLQQANLSEEDLRENMKQQLVIQQYLDKEVPEEETKASEEEVTQLYEQYSAQSDNVPALEEMRDQLKSQVESQKLNEFLSSLIRELRADSEIEILI